MDWWVSKDHTLNLKSLLSHSPSQLMKTWAILNQTKSTFLRLPVRNNIYLGCHNLKLEQSPHIPYGENRRLEWDWEELCNSFWRFGEKKGWEAFERAVSQFGENPFWNSRVKLPGIGWHESLKERSSIGKIRGREVRGNWQFAFTCLECFICSLTFWLPDLFICFARKTSEDSGLGLEKYSVRDSQPPLWPGSAQD